MEFADFPKKGNQKLAVPKTKKQNIEGFSSYLKYFLSKARGWFKFTIFMLMNFFIGTIF